MVLLLALLPATSSGSEIVSGRESASNGLPQFPFSFSTVEVNDHDDDGSDEMFLGGCGFLNMEVKTEGIMAFEFDASSRTWEHFGSGLPGEGSGKYYGALGLGDVNGDGEMDIAAPIPSRWYEASGNGIDIYAGDGAGGFSLLYTMPMEDGTSGSSNEVEIEDLDGDGHNDLIASTYTGVNVWFGDGSGTNWVESSPSHPKRTEISGIGIGDLDGDGLLDIVGTPYQYSDEVEMYVQGSRRTWRDVPFKETAPGYGVKIADLDKDGDSDVMYGTGSEGIKVWLGEGSVGLTSFPCTDGSSGLPAGGGPVDQIELGDVNGDGRPDLIAAFSENTTARLFINDLPSGWVEVLTGSASLVVGGDNYGANFGDWDGDGGLDCAACSWEDGVDTWLIQRVAQDENAPPTADAGEDLVSYVSEKVTLDGSGSYDPDGSVSQWEWKCTSHSGLTLERSSTPRPSFVPLEEGDYLFSLRVMDDSDAWSDPDMVKVSVIDSGTNLPPVADAGSPVTGMVGENVVLDGSGSYDPDGEILKFIWTCTSHQVPLENGDGPNPSFVPDEAGDYFFSLVVEDDEGAASGEDRVTVHITDPSGPPSGNDDDSGEGQGGESGGTLVIVALVLFAVFIAGALAALFIWGRGKKDEVVAAGIVEEAPPACQLCRGPLVYSNDFQRYMCTSCGRYY